LTCFDTYVHFLQLLGRVCRRLEDVSGARRNSSTIVPRRWRAEPIPAFRTV